MDLFKRHASLSLLVAVLFLQVVALAYQVKRPTDRGPVRLIRMWGVGLVTPAENAVIRAQDWVHNVWHDYFYLRDVRRENERLQDENLRLRLEQVRLAQDAGQAQRIQSLLKFKEQFISDTMAAQVIGTSGTETSRVIYIDKGVNDGVKADMAVITPSGIVGKVIRTFPNASQVLEINDQSSGVGAILEKSRLQGILKGTPSGESMVHYIMNDEKVEAGEMVLTSGGDRIFPKGLPIGRIVQVTPGPETFLNIRVKPSAQLDRLEEVLIITRMVEQEPGAVPDMPMRASEILAQRLPTIPVKPPELATAPTPAQAAAGTQAGTAPAGAAPASAGTGTGTTQGGSVKPGTAAGGTVFKTAQTKSPAPQTNATAASANPAGVVKPKAASAPGNVTSGAKPATTATGTTKPSAAAATQPGASAGTGTTVPKPKPANGDAAKPGAGVTPKAASGTTATNVGGSNGANAAAAAKPNKPVAQKQTTTPATKDNPTPQ